MAMTARPQMTPKRSPRRPLAGRVALVAGATRGAGRGIARALAAAGATVYCTGRSVTGKPSPYGRPETINETATLIKAAGGAAIAVRVGEDPAHLTPMIEEEGLRAGRSGRAARSCSTSATRTASSSSIPRRRASGRWSTARCST